MRLVLVIALLVIPTAAAVARSLPGAVVITNPEVRVPLADASRLAGDNKHPEALARLHDAREARNITQAELELISRLAMAFARIVGGDEAIDREIVDWIRADKTNLHLLTGCREIAARLRLAGKVPECFSATPAR